MIYLDTSVALAHLLAEDRRPPDAPWREELVSSRLLEYELWTRLLLARLALLDLRPAVLERAVHPCPVPVRTLDALHPASLAFLREHGKDVRLATYDERMADAAVAMGVELEDV